MKRRFVLNGSLASVVLLLLVTGCQEAVLLNPDGTIAGTTPGTTDATGTTTTTDGSGATTGATTPAGSSAISFNFTGAKAIGVADIAASRALRSRSGDAIALSRNPSDQFGLVRVMEDGSVELAMQFPPNTWMPQVLFIAVSPLATSSDVFVAFSNSISYHDSTTQQQVNIGSFLHIKADGTYHSIIDDTNGRVKDYSWYGNDNYQPISFDAQGNVYYVFTRWGSSSSSDRLFVYNPTTQTNTPLTPALTGQSFHNFEVSPDGRRLFVQGERQSGGQRASFFRMYPIANIENPVTVFYSSTSNTWVRGYRVSPAGAVTQNVILNGNNIRGINGLLRANVVSDTQMSYEPLYDSSTQSFTVQYSEWYSDWEVKTYHNGLFDIVDLHNTYLMMTDGTAQYYLSVNDLRNAGNGKWSEILQSLSVVDDPTRDWNAQTRSQMNLKPVTGEGAFGFAVDNGSGGYSVLYDTNTDPVANPTAVTYTVKSYLDRLSATDLQRLKVFSTVWRNTNGTSGRVLVPTSPSVVRPMVGDGLSRFIFNSHWFDQENQFRSADFLAYVAQFLVGQGVFTYGGQTGTTALAAFVARTVYLPDEVLGPAGSLSDYFLTAYFRDAQGNPVVTLRQFKTDNNLNWLNFQNVSNIFYDAAGACWAVVGGGNWGGSSDPRLVRILDATGTKTLAVHDAFKDATTYRPVSFLFSGNRAFFRHGMRDSDGFETGFHKLYMIDTTNLAAQPVDLLTGLGADNGRLEIVSFSVNETEVYFTGVKGTGVVGGRVDLQTRAYTPLADTYLLRDIEIY